MDENPTLEQITSSKIEEAPTDTPQDLVNVAKLKCRLKAFQYRIYASRQSTIERVKLYSGRADGLVDAIEILDEVFSRYADEDEDDEPEIEGEVDDAEKEQEHINEQGIY